MTMILRKKRGFKQKAFFIIFKERSIKQVTEVFLEVESSTLNYLDFKTLQSSENCSWRLLPADLVNPVSIKYSNNPSQK